MIADWRVGHIEAIARSVAGRKAHVSCVPRVDSLVTH